MTVAPIPAGPVTFPCGPGQTPDNLTGLASANARALGVVGTSSTTQYYDDNIGPIKITTGASDVSATGQIKAYLIFSEDNTNWTNGISPTSTSDQAALLAGLIPYATIDANANDTAYYVPWISVATAYGGMPSFWSVVIENLTGAAFSATAGDHVAQHNLISYP